MDTAPHSAVITDPVPLISPRWRRRFVNALATIVGLALCAVFIVPIPYVIITPGPTVNLNASYLGHDIITIQGQDPIRHAPVTVDPTYDGELRMVTVSEYGGPGHSITTWNLLEFAFDGVSEIVNYSDIYSDEVTADEVQSFSQALMTSSHSTSTVAALEALGWQVPAVVSVTGAVPQTDAEGKVQSGDVIVSATTPDGTTHRIDRAGTIFALMGTQPPGTTIRLDVTRDGTHMPLDITSGPSGDGVGSKLGVYLDIQMTPPVDVHFNVEDIGGPSAGMMFALAIIDRLTPGDLTGGHSVAGTGAISYDGRVNPIGGLPQKIVGARDSGAEYFLAPSANCDELDSIPSGIAVYRVDNLTQALDAVKAIANGTTDALPACFAQ